MSAMRDRLEAMLASGEDTALLRFSLGNAWIDDDPACAADHYERAIALDPAYSAAWKQLGKALTAAGRHDDAVACYERGIVVAGERGDKQAEREMQVFLKRLRKDSDG